MRAPSRHVIRLVVSGAISLLVLALLFRLVGGGGGAVGPAALLGALRRLAWPLVGVYLLAQLLQAWLRAARYRLLLLGSGDAQVPAPRHLYLVTLTRNMFVDLLPARAGELSYVAMLNRGYRVPAAACVSSLTVSMLFDFVALLLVLVLALSGLARRAAPLAAAVLLVVLVGVGWWGLFRGIAFFARQARRLAPALCARRPAAAVLGFLDRLAAAITAVRRSGRLPAVLGLSAAVRAAKYGGLYFLFLGVTRALWPELAGASPWAVMVTLIAAEGGASLPVPAFMSFGTYEAGGLAALSALGFPPEDSAVALIAMHVVSQAVDYSLGGLALVLFTLTTGRRAPRPPGPRPSRGRFVAVAALAAAVVASAAALGWEWRRVRRLGAWRPPARGAPVADPRGARRAEDATGGIAGFLVWSSNREGNHEILRMDFPGGAVRRLTDHPHADTFPRVSPDGRRVVFCRSQLEWVSQRDPLPWDVYALDLESGAERLLARDGNTPTWSEDGGTVYFQRNGGRFVAHETATGTETVLFESGRDPVPAGVQLQTPDFDARSGRLAVTWRGARRAGMVLGTDGTARRIGGGCQWAWSPARDYLAGIGHGGRRQNAVYRADPETLVSRPWLDLPEPYSHEYFPRVSNDGRWLALGAAAEGHEHDTADYEIFLWRIGTPADEAVRVTFHTGNDNWPDLWVAPGR